MARQFILHTLCFILSISASYAQNLERIPNRHAVYPQVPAAVMTARAFTPVTMSSAHASGPKPLNFSTPWTAAGKDFYACFLSVVGSNDMEPSSKIRSLFISSRAPARVTIEVLKTAFRETVLVTPGTCTRVEIPLYDALGRNDYEQAESKVIHIFSNEVISVYGFAHNSLSSDGFIVYPTPVLGTSYMVMSSRNAVDYNVQDSSGTPLLDTVSPRSEFAIVATQNNTQVTFTLSATSFSGRLLADLTYSIRLDRGQVYQIMARDTGTRLTGPPSNDSTLNWWDAYRPWNGGPDCDLTGSYITSDKPIAVFGGHERAAAPTSVEYDYAYATRDHLDEEMLPISAWGKNYIIAGSGQDAANGRRAGGDAVRILSAFDSAHVSVNGKLAYTLGRSEYCDFMSGTSTVITSDEPILVAHFMQSSNDSNHDDMGDPDLTLARPVEDYANEYTLPPWHDIPTYTEGHLLVICDTSATKTTLLNGLPLQGGAWNPIPGTPFTSGIFRSSLNEQRIESPMPCYAESFAYGMEDSYAYAGGGDYPYVDSLFAVNLNFPTIPVGQANNKTSPLHTSPSAKDTVQVYNYEWVSGDTSSFTLVGGLNQSPSIAPRGSFPVSFIFHPSTPRYYSALLRVWSDAVNPVFIRLQGSAVAPQLAVLPDTIDFGRVRLGTKRDSSFIIENTGTTTIQLTDLDYGRSLDGTDFTADSVKSPLRIILNLDPAINPTAPDTVHFQPTTLGPQIGRIPIFWTDLATGTKNDTPVVVLLGVGVEPSVASTGYDFGSLRVDSVSDSVSIRITNHGTDATEIDSITIVNPAERADFGFDFSALLKTLPIPLIYEDSDTSVSFSIRFQPQSLGVKTLVLRIHTVDGDVIYDTLTGRGVEPLITVSPQVIDFGTIHVQPSKTPIPPIDSFFSVSNIGTMPGALDSLVHQDTNFDVRLGGAGPMLGESLDSGSSLSGTVSFKVTAEGDFADTVYVTNDTRYNLYPSYQSYQPRIILKAKVRTDTIGNESTFFGTITTCDLDSNQVMLYNPYPVEVQIDSLALLSDTAGFSYHQPYHEFGLPIFIPPDSSYPLNIYFSFPPDSLNGLQVLKLGLYQQHLDGEPPVVDTVTAALIRKQRVFTLHAHLPQFASSANDVSYLKLPITVEGPRAGVTELNSWTLSLHFSNDLFEPVGIDTTGALAVRGDSTFTMTTHWDQATRTYTIVVTGSAVSDSSKIKGDLLLSILMRAYLTTDTVVTVTPTFTWAHHPCAYNLQSFTLQIPYADDCGDPTIRRFMLGEKPYFTLIGVWPNPVDRAGGVQVGYDAAAPSRITCEVFTESGEEIGHAVTWVQAGAGTLAVGTDMLPHSGAAFIRVEATPVSGGAPVVKTVRVDVTK